MKRVISGWAVAFGLAMFLGHAGSAWACSMALWYHVVPEHGAADVPLNARISVLISGGGQPAFRLFREANAAADEEVAFTISTAPGDNTYQNVVLVPDAPLAAHTRYRVELAHHGDQGIVTSFTTGDAADTAAPAAPTVEVRDAVPYVPRGQATGGECYVGTGFVHLSAHSDEPSTFLLRQGATTIAAGLPSELRLAISCPAPDRKVDATIIAVDLAGNESEPVAVQYTERCVKESAFGCSAAGGTGVGVLALLGLGLLLRRRTAG
jgi:uncharacterized protein (TIGR03382 family)